MQPLHQHLPTPSTSMPASSTDDLPAQPQPLPEHWVERLFERLAAILGVRMGDIVASSEPKAIAAVKREWAEALAGFADDELRRGIAATRTRRFPPNLPEFLHLCRPALDPEVAWLEAAELMPQHVAGKSVQWSHPAVYWAARDLQHELRTSDFQHQRKRWERAMAGQWAKGFWATPPDPTQRALPQPEQRPLAPFGKEEAVARLKSLRQQLAERQVQSATALNDAAAPQEPGAEA